MSIRELSIAFQTDKSPAEYIALAQLVNQFDFDVVSVYCDAPFHPSYGPLLLMAPHIKTARIGAAAISPSRIHPIDIAAQSALLSQAASRGTYIGLARGGWLDTFGISEIQPPVEGIREAVEVIRYLHAGRTDGYNGRVFRIAPHIRAPYPLPEADIPLLIGTWGQKLCAVAGAIADEVKIGGSANPDVVPIIRDYIQKGETAAGRPPGTVNIVIGAVSVIDEDREKARWLARREVALYLPIVAKLDPTVTLEPELVDRLKYFADRQEYDSAARLIPDNLLDRFAFAGNADDFIRQSEALFDTGVTRIEFGTPHGIDSTKGIQLLGSRVLPVLRRSNL